MPTYTKPAFVALPAVLLAFLLPQFSIAQTAKILLDSEGSVELADVALRTQALLTKDAADEAGGGSWNVATTPVNATPQARVAAANESDADRLISFSLNENGSGDSIAVFAFSDASQGAGLRDAINAQTLANLTITAPAAMTLPDDPMLRDTPMPAVKISLSAAFIAEPQTRDAIAQIVLFALQTHYSIGPYMPVNEAGAGIIEGKVQSEDGPIMQATVQIAGFSQLTDENGTFMFADVPAGNYLLSVYRPGYVPSTEMLSVIADEVTEAEVMLMRQTGPNIGPTPDSNDDTLVYNPDAQTVGGCQTASAGSLLWTLLLLAFFASRHSLGPS